MGRRLVLVTSLAILGGLLMVGCQQESSFEQEAPAEPTAQANGDPNVQTPPRRLQVNPNAQMGEPGSKAGN